MWYSSESESNKSPNKNKPTNVETWKLVTGKSETKFLYNLVCIPTINIVLGNNMEHNMS